ncbi:hypothetical protein D3C75_631930 [compost metagenome]
MLCRTEGKEINHDFRDTSTARREALIHRDKLIIELLDKHEVQRRDHETNMNIAFGLALMFAVNFLNLGTSHVLSLTQTAATLPDTITGFWVNALIVTALITFTAFLLAILAMSLAPETSEKIYLPESDEEKAARLERAKKMKLPNGVYLG